MMKFHLLSRTLIIVLSVLSSHSSFAYKFDRNVSKELKNQVLQDLEFINSIQSNTQSDLHKQVFGAVSGETYTRFFSDRVTAVGLNGCGSANAVACVIPFLDPSKMWLTQNYIQFDHPQIARLMVVFHEARHTESQNDNWPHANCPQPFLNENQKPIKSIWTGAELAGEAACDETPFGSYGSSTILLKNIAQFCTNCTGKVKMDANLYADDQLQRIIDEPSRQKLRADLYPNK